MKMFEYGVQTELSDIRAHVGMTVCKVYVFPTKETKELIEKMSKENMSRRPAYQPGVSSPTAWGFPVPWEQIPRIKEVRFPKGWILNWKDTLSTTQKGAIAVDVVRNLLKLGRFPLWAEAIIPEDREIQIQGTDIIVKQEFRIQVKCDAKCGSRELGGTGNIYLQTHESNPLGKH